MKSAPSVSADKKRKSFERMRLIATVCVVAAVLLRVGAGFLGESAWVGYLKAFAEAAAVGGLADWFAVTALFRHPFGVPIPHTRILPQGKERLAGSLADFVTGHFLDRQVLERELATVDSAAKVAEFLARHSDAVTDHVAEFLPRMLDALDDGEMSRFLAERVTAKIRSLDVGPVVGGTLEMLTSGGRDEGLVTDLLGAVRGALDENRDLLVGFIGRELPIPDFGIPGLPMSALLGSVRGKLAGKIADETLKRILRLLGEVSADPDHEIRLRIQRKMECLVDELRNDPAMKHKVEKIRDDLVDNPNVSSYIARIWQEVKEVVRKDLAEPESGIRRNLNHGLRGLAERLASDESFRRTLNDGIRPLLVDALAGSAPACGRVIRETVNRWDGEELADKLELEIGRDLQFVRLNGTLVGGLLGVLLHALYSLV